MCTGSGGSGRWLFRGKDVHVAHGGKDPEIAQHTKVKAQLAASQHTEQQSCSDTGIAQLLIVPLERHLNPGCFGWTKCVAAA